VWRWRSATISLNVRAYESHPDAAGIGQNISVLGIVSLITLSRSIAPRCTHDGAFSSGVRFEIIVRGAKSLKNRMEAEVC